MMSDIADFLVSKKIMKDYSSLTRIIKHNKGFKIIYERPSVTSKKSPNV